MKTPDEIKKGLEMGAIDCRDARDCDKNCAYHKQCSSFYSEMTSIPCVMVEDALALIRRLENDVSFYKNIAALNDKTIDEQAGYIQQLEAQVLKWISVKERLPEECGEVLFVLYGRVYLGDYLWNEAFETPEGSVFSAGNAVTHWMPLPEPPKEDDV